QNYWYRQGAIKYFFVLFLLGFSFRIVTINQLNAGDISLQDKGNKQASKIFDGNEARRGDILDRHGDVLASNLILKRVNLDSTLVQTAFIPKLSEALMMPEEELRIAINKKLSKRAGRKNLIIKKNLRLTDPVLNNITKLKKLKIQICKTKLVKNKLNLLDKALVFTKLKEVKTTYQTVEVCRKESIKGVALEADTRRYYPKSASLAPLLGRVNHDKIGESGIEREYESMLAGHDGTSQLSLDQDSQGSYFNPSVVSPLKHGQDIELTIDANIQFHAYDAIKKSVEHHEADSGSAIILAPNGEILAMVNYPAADPNDKTTYNAQNYRNRVLLDKVEPGSTMKPFTMLLALDQNKITATDDELIDVTKRIGNLKSDTKARKYGDSITVKKILEKSHNLGTVNVSERLSKKDMYNTWNKLGFGQPLGLMPSIENLGSLRHFDSWALSDKRALSYGHGPMETNLAQLARAYLVFANQGAIPHLKLIKNTYSSKEMTQVFNQKSIKKIAKILDSVASKDGSGYRAVIKGYDVAGKTGTAEKIINGKYNKKGINRTFFTGFVPVEKPKYIMAILLDHPKKCYNYYYPDKLNKCGGSNSAAMIFKDAMENILTSDQSIKLLAKN
ncbi:MAG TPA: penicillin-binding protein 2, partial [Piscirickettsiaceae bacterium]|nr:penicillin-binding protein 2 [Piscirickettsiaceae bacterium]